MPHEALREAIRNWLRREVVGLGLCPYASGPLAAGRVRLVVVDGGAEERLSALYLEAERLLATDPATSETTLVVVPDAPARFDDFFDETELAERLVAEVAGEALQVVAFHPAFRFADADAEDPANGVNRSPAPLWHLLRERSVSRVVDADPQRVQALPGRNRDLLRRLSPTTGES